MRAEEDVRIEEWSAPDGVDKRRDAALTGVNIQRPWEFEVLVQADARVDRQLERDE